MVRPNREVDALRRHGAFRRHRTRQAEAIASGAIPPPPPLEEDEEPVDDTESQELSTLEQLTEAAQPTVGNLGPQYIYISSDSDNKDIMNSTSSKFEAFDGSTAKSADWAFAAKSSIQKLLADKTKYNHRELPNIEAVLMSVVTMVKPDRGVPLCHAVVKNPTCGQ